MKRAVLMLLIGGALAAQSIEMNTGKFWRLTWRIRELERQIKDQGPDASWSAMLASLNAEFQFEQKRLAAQCFAGDKLGYTVDSAGNVGELACVTNGGSRFAQRTAAKWNLPKRAIRGLRRIR